MRANAVIVVCLCALIGIRAAEASPLNLFSRITYSGDGNSPPPLDALVLYDSSIDVTGLAGMPSEVSVQIPNATPGVAVTMRMTSMDRREGFAERDPVGCNSDAPPPGACELIPVPGLLPNLFSYTWVGRGDDYDLRLTIHRGHAAGVLLGPGHRFEIVWSKVKDLRQEYFHINDELPRPNSMSRAPASQPQAVPVMSAAAAQAATYARIEPKSPAGAGVTDLDMLVLITEEARRQAGGNPSDCRDMDGSMMYVYQNIASINTAFQTSLIPARVGAVTVSRLTGYSLIPDDGFYTYTIQNLDNIRASSNIQAFRNAVGADVVSTVFDTQTHLGPCGVAYIQRSDCGTGAPGCGTGALFSQYTHLLETIQCNVMDTFTHELGHVLGAEHDRQNSGATNTTASFPYSFGYGYGSGVPDGFETIMSQKGFNDPNHLFPVRLLQFSNPNVFYHGRPTGAPPGANAATDNALTLTNLLPGTAAYRVRPNLIFANGFDEQPMCPAVIW